MKQVVGLGLAGGLVVLALSAGSACAVVINVDFQPGGAGGVESVSYTGQGALPDTGNDVWNVVDPSTDGAFNGEFGSGGPLDFGGSSYTTPALVDSSGAATPVTVTVSKGDPEAAFAVASTNGSMANIATNAPGLMSDYLIAQDDAQWITINNLSTGALYSLYLYGAGDLDFRNTTFIAGGFAKTTTGVPGGTHALTEGQDYVVFHGIPADAGAITVSFQSGGESTDGNFNGFQLVEAQPVGISTATVSTVAGLAFTSTADSTYRLQYTTNLLGDAWVTAPIVLIGTGGSMTAFDPAGFSTQKSYRIVEQ